MDQFGKVSEPHVHEGCMDSETYIEECIIRRLIPFIKNYHSIENLVFWPDLSTIHYAKKVKTEIEKNMTLVQKINNPPNIPHLRPVEKFWALCKNSYSKLSKSPDTLRKFQFQWKKISNEVAKSSGKSLMSNLKQKIKYEIDNGPKASIFASFNN